MLSEFADAGCRVAGVSRSAEAVKELTEVFGKEHRFQAVHVSNDRAVENWAETTLSDFGPPEILINNAAVINSNAALWNISAEEFDSLTATNINGTANTIRHFVPAMTAKGTGIIVNISSGWGRSVSAKVAPYCASKWAIEGLSLALAEELPSGMACVPLNPGVIYTEMLRSCFGASAEMYPSPAEWAKTAAPFILNLSAADNGKSLTVPGH